jgi:hypothetical protein
MGYVSRRILLSEFAVTALTDSVIRLHPHVVPIEGISVTSILAREGRSPSAFTTLSKKDIEREYYGQDLPMLLMQTPGAYAYSDAGNGIGYSYLKIRGFASRRIGCAVNTDEARLSRRVVMLLGALLVGHALLAYQARARGIFTFGDDASYLLLSQSLRAFSYREVQFIGAPIAAHFPPGYPALLALLGIAGEHLRLISLAGIALSVSGLYALFDDVRRRWSSEVGLLVTAVAATNPTMVANAGAVASESMFTALAFWTLCA